MTCHETREWLSAYLDEALAPEERGRVEAHLASCAECPRELASLRQTVALLQQVQPARAPVGFVDRVVAAARPGPWYRRLADAVLLRPTVKLPLQVTAAVMIGLLAVYLFERTPELQQAARQEAPRPAAPAPEREQPAPGRPAPAEPLADKATRSTPAAPARPESPSPARVGGERDRGDAPRSQEVAPPIAASPPVAGAPAPPAAAPPPIAPPPEAKLEARKEAPPSENVAGAVRLEAESRQEKLQPSADSARAAPSSSRLAAKRAVPPVDVVARVAVKDRDAAEGDLTALIARVGGSVTQRRREAEATVVEAVIPQPRYAEFSESLARIGTWRVEAERPDLPAQIRVILRLH